VARRVTPCPRNLDDPLQLSQLGLSIQSLGLCFCCMLLFVGLELSLRVFSLFFGHWGLSAAFMAAILAGVLLRQAEKHDDQHFVPSAVMYYLFDRADGPIFWRQVLYSPGVPEEFDGHVAPGLSPGSLVFVTGLELVVLVLQASLKLFSRTLGGWALVMALGAPIALAVASVRANRRAFRGRHMEWVYRAHRALAEDGEGPSGR
jgi:hypothetical protein